MAETGVSAEPHKSLRLFMRFVASAIELDRCGILFPVLFSHRAAMRIGRERRQNLEETFAAKKAIDVNSAANRDRIRGGRFDVPISVRPAADRS